MRYYHLIVLFLCLLYSTSAVAQLQLSAYGVTSLPGSFSSYVYTGWGAGMSCRYAFLEGRAAAGFKGEYISFQPRTVFGHPKDGMYYSVIPFMVQGTYYFLLATDRITPFASINLGAYHENVSAESTNFGYNAFKDYNKLSFGLCPEAGVHVKLVDGIHWTIGSAVNFIPKGLIREKFGNMKAVNLNGGTTFFNFYTGIVYTFPQ